ncbi:MAG: BACON domain-containing protein [Muribaculaceae bacterium]|nr:BACON domain-containing protein [Muribaculaceae bacterium]
MRKNDFLWSLLTILMAVTLSMQLSSCKKDEVNPELSVSKTSISLQANGDGEKDIIVLATDTDWTVSVTEGSSWLSVSKNGQFATISVDANNTTQARSGKLKIAATVNPNLAYEITVTQAGADGSISVSLQSVDFEAEGGSQSINVTSNSGWTANTNQAWLTISPSSCNAPASGSESTNVTLSVGENTTNEARSCTVTFTSPDNKTSATVNITQKKPSSYVLVNGQETTSLQFTAESGINYKQTVKVTSNVSWTIDNIPDWLSVSPTNGNGAIDVNIYPKSANDTDDKERTTKLVLLSGDAQATINVTQETGLASNVDVTPTNIVTLYNGIAFDYSYGKDVAYFYGGYMEKSKVTLLSDAEIISILQDIDGERLLPSEKPVTSFSGLDENTTYMIYTVGYNTDGKRGKLIKTEISTKKLEDNEPQAFIYDMSADSSNWYWTIEKSLRCTSYYLIYTEDEMFAYASDAYQAWRIDKEIRNNNISEYDNGRPLSAPRAGGDLLAVMTWGLNRDKFASLITWKCGILDRSSISIRKTKKHSKTTREIKNYKNSEGNLTVYIVR